MPLFRILIAYVILGFSNPSQADEVDNKLVIRGSASNDSELLTEQRSNPVSPDVSESLSQLPGAHFNQNGKLSILPQYRGHIGSRTSVAIDGVPIVSAGPNLMDAPLSYAIAGWVESMSLYRGIAPVSAGQESLASHVDVHYRLPDFNSEVDGQLGVQLRLGYSSNGHGQEKSLLSHWANENQRTQIAMSSQTGDDVSSPTGIIEGTQFDKEAQRLLYGFKLSDHQFDFSHSIHNVNPSGTPALPMDILFIDGQRDSIHHRWKLADISWSFNAFVSHSEHGMDNFSLRPTMPSMQRSTFAETEANGVSMNTQWDGKHMTFNLGIDLTDEWHSATVSDPTNPMFKVVNFNRAERKDTGLFAENSWVIDENHELMAGVRFKRSQVSSDPVSHSMAMMMPAIQQVQNQFNQRDNSRTYSSEDWMVSYQYQMTADIAWYVGIGQKSRTPSYQELYLWIPMQSTGGLADGHVYVGDVDLDLEIATQAEIGLTLQHDSMRFAPQLYFHDLHDYIQGVNETNMQLNMIAQIMNANQVLRFANVDGRIYGLDMDMQWNLDSHWRLDSVISMVRGERSDIDESLYRIMPDNIRWSLNYLNPAWRLGLDWHLYKSQDRVATSLGEPQTSGYALVNLHGEYNFSHRLTLSYGLDNVFNKNYTPHTSGVNRRMNNIVAIGERLPGLERTVYVSLSLSEF